MVLKLIIRIQLYRVECTKQICMKKILLGLFSLILCVNSFAQSDSQSEAFKQLFTKNIEVVSKLINKLKPYNSDYKNTYLNELKSDLVNLENVEELNNDNPLLNEVVNKMGFADVNDFTETMQTLNTLSKNYATLANIENEDSQKVLEALSFSFENNVDIRDLLNDLVNNLMVDDGGDGGGNSDNKPCKNVTAYTACLGAVLITGLQCGNTCNSMPSNVHPLKLALCLVGCLTQELLGMYLCHVSFCK